MMIIEDDQMATTQDKLVISDGISYQIVMVI